jgi:excisionase family DNA binding protein
MTETGTSGATRARRGRQAHRTGLGERHPDPPSKPEGAPASDYATVEEGAGLLRVCTKTVYARIHGGHLEAYRHGRRILIPRRAIDRLIKSGPI